MLTICIYVVAVMIYTAVVWVIGYRTGADYGKWLRENRTDKVTTFAYSCECCGFFTRVPELARSHVIKGCNAVPFAYSCEWCGFNTQTPEIMNAHLVQGCIRV